MTEIKVNVEDELVTTLGEEKVAQFLQSMIEQLQLKAAASDALKQLESIDLNSDPRWKQARDNAWHKYMK